MDISSSIKEQQVELFKAGKVKQSTLLKVLRNEVSEMILIGFKPSEIMRNLEHSYGIKINKTNLYSWLKYNKKSLHKGDTKNEEKSIENPPLENHNLGSTDDSQKDSVEEADTSKNDASNDSEKNASKKRVLPFIHIPK